MLGRKPTSILLQRMVFQTYLVEIEFILFHPISKVQRIGISAITLKTEHSAKNQNFAFWFADSMFVCQNKGWEKKKSENGGKTRKVSKCIGLFEFLWEDKFREKNFSESVRNQELMRIMKEICSFAFLARHRRMKL